MTATSISLWGPLFAALIVAAIVTPLSIKAAPKIGAMDIPKDERRMHDKAMPRFGGVAIYAGIMVALAIFASDEKGIISIMVGCTMIYILGLIDDIRNLSPIVKLLGQVACAVLLYVQDIRIEFITNYFGEGSMVFGDIACFIITVLWVVAITNAVNLIDGLDGLASGIAASFRPLHRVCGIYTWKIYHDLSDDGHCRRIAGLSAIQLPSGEDLYG